MELSYIWIEQFRNLEKQEFNFSTECSFHYDATINQLSSEINPLHIKKFFGNRILNVTGLIGQNASGKTNVLELIIYMMNSGTTKIDSSFFVLTKSKKGTFSGYYYNMEVPKNDSIRFIPYGNNELDIDTIFISNIFDGRRHNFSKETRDLSTNNLINNKFRENFHTLYNNEIQQQIRFINSDRFSVLEQVEKKVNPASHAAFNPTHIRIAAPAWGVILTKSKTFDDYIKGHYESGLPSLNETCKWFRSKMARNITERNSLVYFTSFLVYIDFLISQFQEETITSLPARTAKSNLSKLLVQPTVGFTLEQFYRFVTETFSKEIEKTFADQSERFRFLNDLDGYQFTNIFRQEQGKYSSRKVEFLIEYNAKIGSFVRAYLDAIHSNTLSFSFEWEGISSGHKAYISLFSRFYNYYQRRRSQKETILICMDEGDLYFHPKWQTEFLYKLINILPEILSDESVQIILSTHSPFLVSDLPVHNLLFLKKTNDGKTIVSRKQSGEMRTFGGNIGDLYEDAFFLEGNQMSRFAFEKISGLVARLINSKIGSASDDDLKLIDQIGELLIRNKLKSLTDGDNKGQQAE